MAPNTTEYAETLKQDLENLTEISSKKLDDSDKDDKDERVFCINDYAPTKGVLTPSDQPVTPKFLRKMPEYMTAEPQTGCDPEPKNSPLVLQSLLDPSQDFNARLELARATHAEAEADPNTSVSEYNASTPDHKALALLQLARYTS